MPWHIEKRGSEYCVIKDSDGSNEGCSETRTAAERHMRALYASEGDSAMAEIPWRSVAVLEGLTDDGRWYKSIDWRELPLEMTLHHDDNQVIGRVDSFERHAGGVITAQGVFIDTPEGAAAAYLLESQATRGMSVETIGDYEFVCTTYEDFGYGPECVDGLAVFDQATIVRVSMVGAPAFGATLMQVVPDGESEADAVAAVEQLVVNAVRLKPPEPSLPAEVIQASLAVPSQLEVPLEPPLSWFEVPEPDGLVPLHIEANGQIFGHIAPRDECHVGIQHECVTAPLTRSGYAYFNMGRICAIDDDGQHVEVACGQVTMTTGHGDKGMTLAEAISHYDNTGTCVGYVHVSEGQHGPWVCGTAKPGISPMQVIEFNAAKPSGHWVPVRGHNELMAVLMVNSPGFPVVASFGRLHEDGTTEPQGLILSLPSYDSRRRPATDDLAAVWAEVDRLRSLVAALVDTSGDGVFEALAASVR